MARRDPIPKRESRVTIPTRCHPAAKLLFQLMKEQRVTYDELSHYSGVNVTTFKSWRNEKKPSLENLEACLGVLGWRFLPVPGLDKVPPELRGRIVELAREWEGIDTALVQLVGVIADLHAEPLKKRRQPQPQPRLDGRFASNNPNVQVAA
jgi:hypothetical protein